MNSTLRSNLFAFTLILLWVLGSIFLPYLLYPLNLPMPVQLVLTQALLLLVPSIIYFIVTKASIKKTLKLNWPGGLTILLVIFIALFIQPAMMFLSALSGLFFHNDVGELITNMNSYPLVLMLGVVALTPAICEEITMRGILLSGYDKIDIKKAMLINGLFFGMLHLDLQQFLYAFALGALFAYIVRTTNSIIPTMVAHFTVNGSQLVMQRLITYFAKLSKQDLSALTQKTTSYDMLIALGVFFFLALIITPVAGVLIYALRSIHHDKNLTKGELEESENDTSTPKVSYWPVWAAVGIYIPFMALTQFLLYLNTK